MIVLILLAFICGLSLFACSELSSISKIMQKYDPESGLLHKITSRYLQQILLLTFNFSFIAVVIQLILLVI